MARPPSDPPEDEKFLARWSRLKEELRRTRPPDETEAQPSVPEAKDPERKPVDLKDLPPIDSLSKDSDYSLFMRTEVPEELRRKALRKLWALDPAGAMPDPLDMYNLDFNGPGYVADTVKTLYRVGQGMLDPAEEPESAPPPPAPGALPEEKIPKIATNNASESLDEEKA